MGSYFPDYTVYIVPFSFQNYDKNCDSWGKSIITVVAGPLITC